MSIQTDESSRFELNRVDDEQPDANSTPDRDFDRLSPQFLTREWIDPNTP
jgi:hypothetical protein